MTGNTASFGGKKSRAFQYQDRDVVKKRSVYPILNTRGKRVGGGGGGGGGK